MPLYFALLLSLALHIAMIGIPSWLGPDSPMKQKQKTVEVTLVVPEPLAQEVRDLPEDSSTLVSEAPLPAVLAPAKPSPKPTSHSVQRAQTALAKHLHYPPQAIAQGLEGEVTLLLKLDGGGKILAVEVVRSSGHALLDQAALDAARRMGSLPGNPRQTLLPVAFSLQ